MRNRKLETNISNLDMWVNDSKYLMEHFSSLINELGFNLSSINATQTKFRVKGNIVVFLYDVNRYGGRTLEDVYIEKNNGRILKLSLLVLENSNKKLHEIISENSKNNITPMKSFTKLFLKYFYKEISEK